MNALLQRRRLEVGALGLLAFVLLAVRFSPNWMAFYDELQVVEARAPTDTQRAAIQECFQNTFSALRGAYVEKQASDPKVEIDDPNHKIIRWRLLFPVLGHLLRLPGWIVLGLAQLGCLALITAFVAIGSARRAGPHPPYLDALCLGVVAGASAPFFTSMGWLGYYDTWLALALIGVGFARSRWWVMLACLLAPWIDERFVIGLPLALCVRWMYFEQKAETGFAWIKAEALLSLFAVSTYALFRLHLGGTGGSQTVGDYFRQFVLAENLLLTQRLSGAWQGLRLGWFLVAMAIFGRGEPFSFPQNPRALLLAAFTLISVFIGLYTARDLSRSMVLILPVVPLGWNFAARTGWWSRFHLAPLLAAVALLLPARQVTGTRSLPVDNLWTTSSGLQGAYTNLGNMYADGASVPKDNTAAVAWYRKAAEQGFAAAEANLGFMYEAGLGVPQESTAAVNWYRKAAEQGDAQAESRLGIMLVTGNGVKADGAEAVKWFRQAAEQGDVQAQSTLGIMYGTGNSVPLNNTEAANWFLRAAEQGFAQAQTNLGAMYAAGRGVPKDEVQALAWFDLAAESGNPAAINNRDILEQNLGSEKALAARKRSKELLKPIFLKN